MSDKYIVKNCPAYIHRPLNNHDRVCLLGDKVKPNHKELYVYCKNCTDCLIKQVIENLKQVAYACHCDNCDGCGYYNGCGDTECGTYQALKSLDLFEIEEVE